MRTDFDVCIVGAGVAGSYLGKKLKNTVIFEKTSDLKIDSGIVSRRFEKLIKKKIFIKKKLNEMQFISPSGFSFFLRSEKPFAYALKRKRFSEFLRKQVKGKIIYEEVKGINIKEDCAEVLTDRSSYSCKIVVGCDGAFSTVRRSLGMRNPSIYYGLRCESDSKEIKVYLNKYFSPDFFAWQSLGEHGLITAIRPLEYFQYFKSKLNFSYNKIYSFPIAIGFTKSYTDNCLLVGDSCGQTKPLSGGGIVLSLIAANHARDIIRKAFKEDYFKADLLSEYEKKWKRDFGLEMRLQLLFRKIYRNLTNKDLDNFFNAFGPHIEKINDFDYDMLSKIWIRLPKFELMKLLVRLICYH